MWWLYNTCSATIVPDDLENTTFVGKENPEKLLLQPKKVNKNQKTILFFEKMSFGNSEKPTITTSYSVGPKLLNIKPKQTANSW